MNASINFWLVRYREGAIDVPAEVELTISLRHLADQPIGERFCSAVVTAVHNQVPSSDKAYGIGGSRCYFLVDRRFVSPNAGIMGHGPSDYSQIDSDGPSLEKRVGFRDERFVSKTGSIDGTVASIGFTGVPSSRQ